MVDLAELEDALDLRLGTAFSILGQRELLFFGLRRRAAAMAKRERTQFLLELTAVEAAVDSLGESLDPQENLKLDEICVRFASLADYHVGHKLITKENSRKATDKLHESNRKARASACDLWDKTGEKYTSVKGFARNHARAFSVTPEVLAGWIYKHQKAR